MLETKTTEIEDSSPGDQGADRIRIRPSEFMVPSEDPFKNDLLDRKSAIKGVTRIVGSAQSPYVISVDAAWGSGKTAFLNMWNQYLENQGYTVVSFNAWETDFADNPFQALSAEITQTLDETSGTNLGDRIQTVKDTASEVAVALGKAALRGAGALVPIAGSTTAEIVIDAFESLHKEPISDYMQMRMSLAKFKKSIGDVSEALSCRSDGKPLVVAIDELDRCRPTYAIELIETVKHIFSVENVVFILAINSTALAHSAKSMYGAEFDAERYFRRFFDLQFRLPDPSRESFVNVLLNSTNVQGRIGTGGGYLTKSMVVAKSLLSLRSLSLRDAEQAAHRLGLILRMVHDPDQDTEWCALVGLSIMVLRPDDYPKFLRGEMEDDQVFEILTANLPFEDPDLNHFKYEIEAVVIALNQSRKIEQVVDSYYVNSPLIEHHRKMANEDDTIEGRTVNDREYSRRVIRRFDDYWNFMHVRQGGSALLEALRSLELVLPDSDGRSDSTSK